MMSNSNVPWRAVQVGASVLALAGGTLGLLANRKVAGVKSARRSDLDDLLDPPPDLSHGSFATADGGKVHYVDSHPDGSTLPTVVLLHGITNQWFTWASVLNGLRADHRVIAWDMRGYGASKAGTRGVDLGAVADDLRILITELELHRVVIAGHSMGGMALGRFAADFPEVLRERVCGMQFLGTTGRALDGSAKTGGMVRSTRLAASLARKGLSGARLSWEDGALSIVMLRSGFGRVATPKMIDICRRCQSECSEQSFIEGLESIAEHDVLERLGAICSPTPIRVDVIVGSDDRLTPPIHSAALQKAIPHGSLVELPGIGHNVMMEKPGVVVNSIRVLASSHRGMEES
jgi:pimeloyl-ACP methyl ester carboxylesterase